MKKTRIAFIKFGGLSAGGTERWLQMMAANLPKETFDIDYFYCDSAPYIGSDYKHADTDSSRLEYMQKANVNLIKFHVDFKDILTKNHDWVDTNFWELFNSKNYDFIQTAKAGHIEYPYYLIDLPIVEYITLSNYVDFSQNIIHSIHLSEWQRSIWLKIGGKKEKSSLLPIPVELPQTTENLRAKLGIPSNAIVAGFHQRPDDNIMSEIPLKSFSMIQNKDRHFIIMGGGISYRKQAQILNLQNVHFIEAHNDTYTISAFLNTLDIFSHGRKDGETFGTVLAEAMIHGLPCLSHKTKLANAQPETMGPGGVFADNLDSYTKALEKLFSEKKHRETLGNLGREHAHKFYTVDSAVQKLEKIYKGIMIQKEKMDQNIFKEILNKRINKIKNNYYSKIIVKIKIIVFNYILLKIYRLIKKKS